MATHQLRSNKPAVTWVLKKDNFKSIQLFFCIKSVSADTDPQILVSVSKVRKSVSLIKINVRVGKYLVLLHKTHKLEGRIKMLLKPQG